MGNKQSLGAQPIESKPAIVIDNGSRTIKTGFAGEGHPRNEFRSTIGRPRFVNYFTNKEFYVGNEAQTRRGILALDYPIQDGVITNFDEMRQIWNYTFDDILAADPRENAVLLTESANNPKENKERTAEIMFEDFHVPGTFIAKSAILGIYAAGRTTGVVIDIGDRLSEVAPQYEGYVVSDSIAQYHMGGDHLTEYLVKLLQKRGYGISTTAERESVSSMKEKLCQISMDYEEDLKSAPVDSTKSYEMPNGDQILIGTESFQCPETLFKPELIELELPGVHKMVFDAVNKCDSDTWQDIYGNIVLAGGSSLFPGMADRLEKEITALAPKNVKVNVITPPYQKHSAWIGGSVVADHAEFRRMLITREEYAEHGANIVHRKCL